MRRHGCFYYFLVEKPKSLYSKQKPVIAVKSAIIPTIYKTIDRYPETEYPTVINITPTIARIIRSILLSFFICLFKVKNLIKWLLTHKIHSNVYLNDIVKKKEV